MPEISVIIPVYNVNKYFLRCVDSFLSQTFKSFELILVDDGSTDGSGALCDSLAAKHDNVISLHKENGGQSTARNFGLDYVFENSACEWIVFADSDDWVHPKYLEILYNTAKKTSLSIAACDYVRSDSPDFGKDIEKFNEYVVDAEDFYCSHLRLTVPPWGKIFKKELWSDVRFPAVRIFEDTLTVHRVVFKCDKIALADAPLYYYFINNESTTNSPWADRKLEVFDALMEQVAYFDENGYKKAHKATLRAYAYYCCYYLSELSGDKNHVDVIKGLKKRLRLHLKKYKNVCDFKIKNDLWYYDNAYPRLMKYYRLIHKI